MGIYLVQRFHRGDLGEVKFTTLCSSTYPYFVALLLTFKLHNSTYPFTHSVSVDVTCDVSDVNSIFFRIHSITCRRADCKRLCCYKVTVQTCKFFLLQFLSYIGINVQRGGNVRMPQSVLHYLDVYTRFAHSRCECMPQGVTAKVR